MGNPKRIRGEGAAAYMARCRERRPDESETEHRDRLLTMEADRVRKQRKRRELKKEKHAPKRSPKRSAVRTDGSGADTSPRQGVREKGHLRLVSSVPMAPPPVDTLYGEPIDKSPAIEAIRPIDSAALAGQFADTLGTNPDTSLDTLDTFSGEGGENGVFSPPSPRVDGTKNGTHRTTADGRSEAQFAGRTQLRHSSAGTDSFRTRSDIHPDAHVSVAQFERLAEAVRRLAEHVGAREALEALEAGEAESPLPEPTLEEALDAGYRLLLFALCVTPQERAASPLSSSDVAALRETFLLAQSLAGAPEEAFALWMVWVELYGRDQALAASDKGPRGLAGRVQFYVTADAPAAGAGWTPTRAVAAWGRMLAGERAGDPLVPVLSEFAAT